MGLMVGLVAGAVAVSASQESNSARPASAGVIVTAEVGGIIHPVSAAFMVQTMDVADEAGAGLVVFTLATPGGLVDSTRTIVTRMLASTTPVVIFVAPAGERAASAGFILTLAADVAAMAPGTHIGAAHPVSAGGEAPDATMAEKATEDVAAWVRTLADGRGRNVTLAAEAVNDSRAFTEREAIEASPPLIDLIATDVPDLLQQLDGRRVRRFDGSAVTLATRGARIAPQQMRWNQRLLSVIAHPNIAFLLLSLGMLGLTVELWTPGAIFPGVVGAVSLVLAFFALQVLPVNYAGVLLLALGILLFGLEIAVTSHGLLTLGGIVSVILGSMMLVDSPMPEMQLSLGFVLPVVVGFAAIAIFLVRLGLRAQRQPAATGMAAMLGATGKVLVGLEPGRAGQVRIGGEIWRAVSAEPLAAGAPVRVSQIDGLTLIVTKA